MTMTNTSVTALLPAYYDRLLLDNLYPDLYLYQFGVKKRIPRNFGKQINFTRYFKAASGATMPLPAAITDGTPVFTSALSANTIQATIAGIGSAVAVSDFIVMTAVSDVVRGAVFELSKGMALAIDNNIRKAISATGTARSAGGAVSYQTSINTTGSLIKATDIFWAAAKLRQNDARTWPDGCYAAVAHPRVGYDIRNTTTAGTWVDINKYATNQTVDLIYRGEIGKMGGVRVVESSNAKRLIGAPISTNASGFMTMVIGPGAYGVVELDGAAASVYVKQVGSAGSADPINQKGTVGVKVYFVAAALEAARMVRIHSSGALL
jgi:N4-gp56 family major capsid protein